MNRQKLLLLVLVVLLMLSVVWSYLKWPRQERTATLKYAPGQTGTAGGKAPAAPAPQSGQKGGGTVLRLDLLEREKPSFTGYRRNIFKPVFSDETKVMKQQAAPLRPLAPPKPVPPPVAVPSVPPSTPRSELARFTFLGFLNKDGRRTVFLAKDRDIILVKQGDRFAGRYEATSITGQALTIKVTDTGEEIVIPLVENQQLLTPVR
jgi:hypothetical protein